MRSKCAVKPPTARARANAAGDIHYGYRAPACELKSDVCRDRAVPAGGVAMPSHDSVAADPSRGRTRSRRSDSVRNRKRLLDATGEALLQEPDEVSIPAVAARAGLSVATAYRYFPSLDDLLLSYMRRVIVELRDYSHDCPKTGTALFEDVAAHWAGQVRLRGAAIVQLRSRRGFLRRLHEGDELASIVRDAWERPIRGVLRQQEVPDEHFDHALFLYNLLFDPREVLDLIDTGLNEQEAVRRLTASYYGALKGWAGAESPNAP